MKMDLGKRGNTNPASRRRVTLSVRLIGELEVRRDDGRPMPVGSARVALLLGYLLVNRSPQPRKRLAFLLWPDSTESQARTNLRHLLHELKRLVADIDRFIELEANALHWKPETLGSVDLDEFEDALKRVDVSAGTVDLGALRQAVDLYKGDLLEGLEAEWIEPDRHRLRLRFGEALEQLAIGLSQTGGYAEAVRYAERLLQLDPVREETYRLLMRLHEAQGARARALRVYHRCVATLARELAIEPSDETRCAYEALIVEHAAGSAGEGATAGTASPRLVGRDRELAILQKAWLASERGATQLVIVSGEAGIGKSRLVEELRSWCAHRGANTADARAYAAEGALAYSPIVGWLRAEAFRSRLARSDVRRRDLERLLPELHDSASPRSREMGSESEERQRLFDAIAALVLGTGSPTLLVADDLQWFDRDSLQCIHYLIRAEPSACALIVATVRREDAGPARDLANLSAGAKALDRCVEIELGRLTQEETAALATSLNRADLQPGEMQELYRETEGNPLFIVEALRGGWRATGDRWTTPKVQGVIESRLARLSPSSRELLTTAAAIGREFTSDVLARASDISGQVFVSALDELWRRRLIRERGTQAYDFSHDKIREVAYIETSPIRRRHDHLRIARALEEIHALDPRAVSGIIAIHYERAGAIDSAITWYERAASAALELGANGEALRILERALNAVGAQPEGAYRDARELTILATLVTLLGSFEGYGSARLAATLRRAVSLADMRRLELPPPVLRSLALTSLTQGNFAAACAAGEQLQSRAARDRNEVLRVEGDYVLGIAAFWEGNLASARRHFEEAVAHYSAEHRVTHLVHYGQDPKVICLSRNANALWLLGEFAAAWQAAYQALVLADEIGHLQSRGTALTFATLLAIEARDDHRVRSFAEAISDAKLQPESIQIRIGAEAISGYVDVLDGQFTAGIARIRRAIDHLGGAIHAPGIDVVLARILLEGCALAKDTHAGLEAADRTLASAGSVRVFEAEVRRLRADFLVSLDASPDEVMAELARAEEIAHHQGARAFELRVALTRFRYCRRLQDADAERAARQQLADILTARPRWDDSPDVRESTALLAD
jgi:DNA-binding SARP family transcriptional activator